MDLSQNNNFHINVEENELADKIILACDDTAHKTVEDIIKYIARLERDYGDFSVNKMLDIVEMAKTISIIYNKYSNPVELLRSFATFIKYKDNQVHYLVQRKNKFSALRFPEIIKNVNKEIINEILLDNKCMVQIAQTLYNKNKSEYATYLFSKATLITKFATDVLGIPALNLDSKKQSLITRHIFCLITL